MTAVRVSRDLLDDLVGRARRAGADTADAIGLASTSVAHERRLGKPETVERAESADIGLRVLVGRRQAVVSTTDTTPASLDALVERAMSMVRVVPEDQYCGLADPAQLTDPVIPDDLADPVEPTPARLEDLAARAEAAGRDVAGVTNSKGAEAGWSRVAVDLVASNGFSGGYAVTRHSLAASLVAGSGVDMQSDYAFSSAVFAEDLRAPEEIGREAGERAVRWLNPGRGRTATLPVVFDPRVSSGLVGSVASAINGASVARGASFLAKRMGERILPAGLDVIDDPLRPRGLASRPFDAEGLAGAHRALVEDGVLRSWILDLRSARQLGLEPTGHASRGVSGPPSPRASNLYLPPGTVSPEALIADIEEGFYVVSTMGMGVNGVTGDYSQGASGFWISGGGLAHPVFEVTVAGNMKDMLMALTAADDLVFRYRVNAPTLRIDGMTVAAA